MWWFGGPRWQSLFTSLVGLGFAGGLIWGVRIGGYLGLMASSGLGAVVGALIVAWLGRFRHMGLVLLVAPAA